jgi:hypothetical protein
MTQVPVTPAPQPEPTTASPPDGRPTVQPGSGLSQAAGGRLAFPGAPPSAPSYEDEIHAALFYEKVLAVKALLAVAIVGAVLLVRFFFLG